LITVDSREAFVYTVTTAKGGLRQKEAKKIKFGDVDGDMRICNTQVAYNGKFFAVGLVS